MDGAQRAEELRDQYRHPGFYPSRVVKRASWDDGARIIQLTRRSKKRRAAGARRFTEAGTIGARGECETFLAATLASSSNWKSVE
jgi:hypothetical protein